MDDCDHEFEDNASRHEDGPKLVGGAPDLREPNMNPFNGVLDAQISPRPKETVRALPRTTNDEEAKRQMADRLAHAQRLFVIPKLDACSPEDPAPLAANDNAVNFKNDEPWPLIDAIKRSGRKEFIEIAVRIRAMHDLASADPFAESIHRPGKSPSPDYHQQRASSTGKVFYEAGQSLDRKKRRYDGVTSKSGKTKNPAHKNGERDAVRYDGSVRIAARSDAGDLFFDTERADMFAQRQIDARSELDDVRAAVGEPLWQPLLDACCGNMTFIEIAKKEKLKRHTDASAFVWRALEFAHRAITKRRQAKSYRDYVAGGFPVPAAKWLKAAA